MNNIAIMFDLLVGVPLAFVLVLLPLGIIAVLAEEWKSWSFAEFWAACKVVLHGDGK